MARLDLRLFIRATPERVWEVISDLEGQKRWMEDVHSLQVMDEGQDGIATQIDVTSKLYGLPLVKDRMIVTVWDPPHRLDVRHAGSFTGTGSFLLEPVPGGTVFTWIEDFRPPLGPIGELGFSAAVGPHLRKVFRRSMDNVRQLAEEA
jgi:carbon monoxide dehydrogenase subunit G